MKDLRIVARVYNNQLRERREATGKTACAFAQSIGVSPTEYCAYETLKRSPLTSGFATGGRWGGERTSVPKRWRKTALRISEALGVDPDVLFPDAVREIKKTTAEVRVDAADVLLLTQESVSPFRMLASGEEADAVNAAISSVLTPREEAVVRRRFFDDETLEEIGDDFEIHRERTRQIQNQALNKLKRELERKGIA